MASDEGIDRSRARTTSKEKQFGELLFLSSPNRMEPYILDSRKLLRSFIGASIDIFIVTATLQYDLVIGIIFNTPHKSIGCIQTCA